MVENAFHLAHPLVADAVTVHRGAGIDVQFGIGHGGMDPLGPQFEQPIEAAQRVRGKDGARRRRVARLRMTKAIEQAVGNDASFARQPGRHGACVILAGHDHGGPIPDERRENPRLL